MSSPLIPDGNYKIVNVAYPTQVADLILGTPAPPVQGFQNDPTSPNITWTLKNVGTNQITLFNKTSQNYAYVNEQKEGEPIVGNVTATDWTPVPSGINAYWIAVGENNKYAWQLTGPNNYAPIVLQPSADSDPKENWTFVKA